MRIPERKIRQWMMTLFLTKWGPEVSAGISAPQLSVILVSDRVIQGLNKKYRRKNKATDVLSFPMQYQGAWEGCQKRDCVNSEIALPVNELGDIVISVETAKRDAKKKGISFEYELKFLLIHGFLHLLGYDHEVSQKEEIRMKRKEREYWKILRRI